MTRINTLPPLDPALTYFVGVDHGAGPATAKKNRAQRRKEARRGR